MEMLFDLNIDFTKDNERRAQDSHGGFGFERDRELSIALGLKENGNLLRGGFCTVMTCIFVKHGIYSHRNRIATLMAFTFANFQQSDSNLPTRPEYTEVCFY